MKQIPMALMLLAAAAGCVRIDSADEALERNRAEIERLVLEEIERFGVDIYRLYLDVSQMQPGSPEANFGGDKAVKKMKITYPGSKLLALAEANVVYGAITRRDMLQIETYLAEIEEKGTIHQLMPNGYEIVPQLVAAQYNYLFHVGRFSEAGKTLDYLVANFSGGFLIGPSGHPVPVSRFAEEQRKILAIIAKKGGR